MRTLILSAHAAQNIPMASVLRTDSSAHQELFTCARHILSAMRPIVAPHIHTPSTVHNASTVRCCSMLNVTSRHNLVNIARVYITFLQISSCGRVLNTLGLDSMALILKSDHMSTCNTSHDELQTCVTQFISILLSVTYSIYVTDHLIIYKKD